MSPMSGFLMSPMGDVYQIIIPDFFFTLIS